MLAALNAIGLAPYVHEDLGRGENTLDKVRRFVEALPDIEEVCVLSDGGPNPVPGAQLLVQPSWSERDLVAALREAAGSRKHIVYFYADCPFLNRGIACEMARDHRVHFADYSFADGYPYGLAPELLRVEALEALAPLASDRPVTRDTLFEIIRRDINSFDIETRISPYDMRLLRLTLAADSKRNTLLLQRLDGLLDPGWPLEEEQVLAAIRDSGEALRTLPAYFNVQIVEGCPQNCTYCPYPAIRGPELGRKAEMALADFASLLDRIQEFAGDAVVSVSLWGEPALHTGFADLAAEATSREGIELLVETSGVGWNPTALQSLRARCPKPPRWIVSLDARDPALYAALRGEGYEEAHRTVGLLHELFPGRVHVQAVRMRENEPDLGRFYHHWKAAGPAPIIQKYSRFAQRLPDRRVSDLSPLVRFPCWHLKRDVAVLLDGTVPLCREDIARSHVLGNAFAEPLAAIWQRGADFYHSHLAEEYPEICRACDEYYTFNF